MNRRDIQFIDKLINMEDKVYTYKFFDDKKRRLAIQGEKIDDTHVEMTIIRCSTKDSFSKKFARTALNLLDSSDKVTVDKQLLHPERRIIAWSSKTLTNWKKEFYRNCAENFYKKTYTRKYIKVELLERNGFKIPIKAKLDLTKLDLY